ncbi:uncharacterized protein zgc:113276 isoform X2 [Ictalurus furcatus]|nr:uncharacterized protein zgc:113276 isoform X2 [Ictalurus furcatus]
MLDVLIVGAGPHALILATLLLNPQQHVSSSNAEILQGIQLSKTNSKTGRTKSKRRSVDTLSELHKDPQCLQCPHVNFKVVDSYGEWASLWESQFTALNIPHLRSHMLVHTNPLNKKALQEFVLAEDRVAELHSLPERVYIQDKNAFFNDGRLGKQNRKLLSAARGLQRNLYFSLPGTQLSVDFFKEQLKQFDVGDVESLIGRYSHIEHGIKLDGLAYLRQFYGERSLHRRLAMIKQARKGGAVTPEAYAHLQPFIQSGQLLVKAYCQVTEAAWCYETQTWKVSLCDGEKWTGDRIWLATGCKLDVNQDPLLSDIKKHFPIQVLEGWPCISETLQWAPGCPVYLMGQYAALQVGPHAVNLAGGQAAALRIAKDIIDEHGSEEQNTETTKVEKSRTEEYISHMHGLMWL